MQRKIEEYLKELREDQPTFMFLGEVGIHTKDCLNDTPLHVAAVRGDLEICQLLVEAGVDINAQGEHDYTPLHEAAAQGYFDVVKLLVEKGARLDLKSSFGDTPLELSELCEKTDIASYLRQAHSR